MSSQLKETGVQFGSDSLDANLVDGQWMEPPPAARLRSPIPRSTTGVAAHPGAARHMTGQSSITGGVQLLD